MFDGLTVAMVTPFRTAALDLEGTARLADFMLDGGVECLVVSGSTGEAATCSLEERRTLWRFVRERVAGRVPVVAGTGSNNTADSIMVTRMAEELGLDGAMLVTPYYNKPTVARTGRALEARWRRARGCRSSSTTCPDAPAPTRRPRRSSRCRTWRTSSRSSEASGSLEQASALVARTRLTLVSGDDALTLPMMAVGAAGVVSVAGNVAPAEMRALTRTRPRRAVRGGGEGPPASAAVVQGVVHRIESRSGQIPARGDEADRERAAVAAGSGRARERARHRRGRQGVRASRSRFRWRPVLRRAAGDPSRPRRRTGTDGESGRGGRPAGPKTSMIRARVGPLAGAGTPALRHRGISPHRRRRSSGSRSWPGSCPQGTS